MKTPTQERLETQLKVEQKAKNKIAVQTIRMMLAAIQKKAQDMKDEAIKKKKEIKPITESEVIQVLQKFEADTVEEITAFIHVKKLDKVVELNQSLEVVRSFLPEKMSEEELLEVVTKVANQTEESGRKIGIILKAVKPLVEGRTDNKTLSATVKAVLEQVNQ